MECNEVELRCKYLPNSQINLQVYSFECAAKLCLAGLKTRRGDCCARPLFMRLCSYIKFAALQDAAFAHTNSGSACVCWCISLQRVFCFTARAAKREKQTAVSPPAQIMRQRTESLKAAVPLRYNIYSQTRALLTTLM